MIFRKLMMLIKFMILIKFLILQKIMIFRYIYCIQSLQTIALENEEIKIFNLGVNSKYSVFKLLHFEMKKLCINTIRTGIQILNPGPI